MALIVAIFAALFSSFSHSSTSVQTFEHPDGQATVFYDPMGKEDQIYKVWAHDTLTTTENDTLNLGFTLASPYQYSYQFKVLKISATPSLKLVLEQRNSTSNSDWMHMDSVSVSGADSTKRDFILRGTNTYGLQHRLLLLGTSGVNQYDATALLKPTIKE